MPQRPRTLTPDRGARHLFGAKMRTHRERAAISLEGLSDLVNISRSHLSRIETAEAMPPPSLPTHLDATFDTDGIFAELYVLATKEIHPDQFRRRMELEARARLIEEFAGQIIPGLVQTAEYSRAQFIVSNPESKAAEIEELLAARMSRQAVLEAEHPPHISFILDEAALRRSFGEPAVMRGQLARLIELSETPTSMVQVLPFNHGGHALLGGTLTLMTLEDGSRVVYEESISTGTLIEDMNVAAGRQRAYDRLRAYALSPADSAEFIRSVMQELPT